MKTKILLFIIVCSFFLTVLIINLYFSSKTNFSNFALGNETVSYWATNENKKPIHISAIDSVSVFSIINTYKNEKKDSTVLILGNSQTHSINQIKVGQSTYVEILHKKFNNQFIFADTYPNASIQDYLITYKFWKKIIPINTVLLPIFMDDLREENGIEDEFYPLLVKNKFILSDSSTRLVKELNSSFRTSYSKYIENIKADNSKLTTQELAEKYLNNYINSNAPIWDKRKEVKGVIFGKLFELRNSLFNIKATTIRRMIPNRYKDNFEALKILIEDAVANNIKVLLYIPPIRNDVLIPYNLSEYANFKNQVKEMTKIKNGLVFFKNFETSVPSNYFGYKSSTNLNKKNSEYDFMHFEYKGHLILADSLYNYILNCNK